MTLQTIPAVALVLVLAPVAFAGCAAPLASAPEKSPRTAPSEAQRLVQNGHLALDAGDTVRAEQYFTLAISKGADEGTVLRSLLAACINGSRLRGALDHALPYLQKHPDDDDLRYLVASIHDSLAQRDEARSQLQRLLNHNPDHADAHYLAGILAAEPEQAREHFRRYLELQPQGRHAREVAGRLADLQLRAQVAATAIGNLPTTERGPAYAQPEYGMEANGQRAWVDVRYPRSGGANGGADQARTEAQP